MGGSSSPRCGIRVTVGAGAQPMTGRYTVKDAERKLRELCELMGKPYGHYVTSPERPEPIEAGLGEAGERYCVEREDGTFTHTQPGAWELDYNPTYGGCVITEIASTGRTWTHNPYGAERRSPREFCDFVAGLYRGFYDGQRSVAS